MHSSDTKLLTPRILVVWGVLVLATVVSWYLGTDHGFSSKDGQSVATSIVLVVAFVKIRFIGSDFMELRHAPAGLRRAFDAWVVVVCLTLVGFYLGGQ
ncbi:cytochrome C oxidase subunit IV family protein [Patulibacter minatonensis]|uniref:cytochrome C oxidase subunit IV family protein n=1 Tax=Patulibacter minatonensis TaxID=298163 RepID=UPI0004B74150|nr:cytochrome C oxidase subunit IV family protein [Patulibacter minatonensis]